MLTTLNVLCLPQGGAGLVKEGLLVGYDVFVLNRGQNADLVQSVFFFSVRQVEHLHLLEGVFLVVLDSSNFVHAAV